MQAISLRSQRYASGPVVSRSRRTTVSVKAWTGDKAPWAGLLRFFVPRKELNVKDDVWPENNFKGDNLRGSHDRKPFKDGFMGAKLEQEASATATTEVPSQGGAVEYLNEAAERVVGHNFKGDASEPQWGKMGAGSRGWSGDVHTQAHGHEQKGGFHSNIK